MGKKHAWRSYGIAFSALIIVLLVWQGVCSLGLVPTYLLPSPGRILHAFWLDRMLLLKHARVTMAEAVLGLFFGVLIGYVLALLMDRFRLVKDVFYPFLIVSQTIPTVAIAPLLVLWFGYEMLPKVILIVLVTFFPVAVNVYEGLRDVDEDVLQLMRVMGAKEWQIYHHVKIPETMGRFFASLKIATSYAVVGAVISEWLGGYEGLGVYMILVKKAFAFDKMFAVIVLISVVSLVLIGLIQIVRGLLMPWEGKKADE